MLQVFAARDVNLMHLGTQRVSYNPKEIHTEAIQATPENIGKLALEFELELNYDNGSGRPFFVFRAERGTDTEPQAPKLLTVRLTDWIVPLWGELHVYRDEILQNTFTFDDAYSRAAQHLLETPDTKSFKPNDRVHIPESGDYGIVTVLDVETMGRSTIEVQLDSGAYGYYRAEDLEKTDFPRNSGEVTGPTGTGIMPAL